MTDRTVLITGMAGFIGFHLAQRLVRDGWSVVGLDNLNDYYDPMLKLARLRELGIDFEHVDQIRAASPVASKTQIITCYIADLADAPAVRSIFETHKPAVVVNLAAQAGVRHSLTHPEVYYQSNIIGFANILEACKAHPPEHLLYASSSSVYGTNSKIPFSTDDNVDHPASLYAATKKSNELMAHCYSHLFGIPSTGLRFFTVYGPWGRPDMACFLFSDWIRNNEPIKIFNHGQLSRDFTFVDDIVEGIAQIIPHAPAEAGTRGTPTYLSPYRVLNIGNGTPVHLMDFIGTLERELGVVARKHFLDMQPGDVEKTWADTTPLFDLTGFRPSTSHEEGLRKFTAWYRSYFSIGRP